MGVAAGKRARPQGLSGEIRWKQPGVAPAEVLVEVEARWELAARTQDTPSGPLRRMESRRCRGN